MWQAPDIGPGVGPQVIFGLDAEGVCTLSFGSGLADLGLTQGELVGQNLFEVYASDPSAVESLRRVLTGESFTVERDFGARRLWVYYEPVLDGEGEVTGALGVSTDVTAQRRIEAEARTARARSALLADLSGALTREGLDVSAMLQVAVGSATEADADLAVIWLYSRERSLLEPRAVRRRRTPGPESAPEQGTRHDAHPLDEAASEKLVLPESIDLSATEDVAARHGTFLAHTAERMGLKTALRVPLRSRGILVGVLDVARAQAAGPFTVDEVGLVCDIAERCALALDNALLLQAQREAREDLVKFQALADASANLIAISDEDGRAVYVNPSVYDADLDLAEDDVWSTVVALAGAPNQAAIRGSLRTTGRWSGDLELGGAGAGMTVRLEVFSLHHPDTGASLGTAWIAEDVTDLRRAEAALRDANSHLKQFKALVEASPDFVAIAGLDGTVKYVNPGGRELVGLPAEVDVTTTSIPDYLTPEGLRASVEVEQPAVIAEGHWEGESTLRNRHGRAVPVAIASFLMRDPETDEPFALATVQRDISERLAAETALRDLADQRQALLTRLVDAQDAERTRIAADVHDDPVQALAAVDLRLGLLRRHIREHAPELLSSLDPLQATVSGATDRLRALLFDLEPPDLQQGLSGALRRACHELFEGSDTHWAVRGEDEPEMPEATLAVGYRIVKEALNNARKHASARHVEVTVSGQDGGLAVDIGDDGVGITPEATTPRPGHRGILTMHDRAAIAGGHCTVRPREGGGTRVTMWLPGSESH